MTYTMNTFLKGFGRLTLAADKVAASSLHTKVLCPFIAVASCLILSSIIGCTQASVTYKEVEGYNTLRIDGQITHDTYLKLKKLYNEYKDFKLVIINSNGGNVVSAIDIGFLFRENKDCLTVLREDTCNSACVFALEGAPYRNVIGKVGIHKPYIEGYKIKTPSNRKKEYDYIMKYIEYFLEYMNMSHKLYDVMIITPSSKIKYLSEDELVSYKWLCSLILLLLKQNKHEAPRQNT